MLHDKNVLCYCCAYCSFIEMVFHISNVVNTPPPKKKKKKKHTNIDYSSVLLMTYRSDSLRCHARM